MCYLFQSNRILKLEGLSSLVNLEELYLSHNGISQVEGLDNLVRIHLSRITLTNSQSWSEVNLHKKSRTLSFRISIFRIFEKESKLNGNFGYTPNFPLLPIGLNVPILFI
jgi:Leucine-rich repeat (LRR) protein